MIEFFGVCVLCARFRDRRQPTMATCRSCRGNLFSRATSDVDHEARLLPLFGRRVSRPHVPGVAAVVQEPFRRDALSHSQNADPPMHSNILSDQAHAKVSPSRIMANSPITALFGRRYLTLQLVNLPLE